MKKIYTTLVALMASLSMQAQGWPANYDGVMLQGFYWDSYRASKWSNLEAQADDLAPYFKLVWIPQSATAAADAQWDTTTSTGSAITTALSATKKSCGL